MNATLCSMNLLLAIWKARLWLYHT